MSCCSGSSCACTCTCGKYKFVNLTGSVIRIYDPNLMSVISTDYAQLDIGYDPKVFNKLATLIIKPDAGITFYDKHVKMSSHIEGSDGCCSAFTMYTHKYQGTATLPDAEENVLYIVPEMVQRAYPERVDLITPYKPVVCSEDTETVIGYCGFYGSVESEETEVSVISANVPNQIIGNINNIVDVTITFSETIPVEGDSASTYTVTIAPVNCQCKDESVDPGIITGSGTTRTITGTVDELNAIFNDKFEVILPSEPSTGSITITVEGKKYVIEVSTLELSVDWSSITNMPNVVTYDNIDDEDGTNIELSNADGKLSVFSI